MRAGRGNVDIAKTLIALAIILICIFVVNFMLSGNFKGIIFAVSIFIIPLTFLYWKQALLMIPIWVIFEGLVRKSVLDSILVFFIKDAVLFVIYFRILVDSLSGRMKLNLKTPITLPVAVFFLWYLLGLFNPNLPNMLMGLVGIKVIFFYIPYFFVTRFLFEDKQKLFLYLKILLILSIFISAFSYYQFSVGDDMTGQETTTHFTNREGERILRPSSTFYYNSNFGQYVYLMFLITISVINIKYFNKNKIILGLIFFFNLLGLLVSGQRTAWAVLGAQFSLFLIFTPGIPRKYSIVPKLAFFGMIATFIIMALFPKSYDSFQERMEITMNDPNAGYQYSINMEKVSFKNILKTSPIFGQGPGTATPASRHLADHIEEVRDYRSRSEGGYVQMWWEIGAFGMAIFAWLLLALLFHLLKMMRNLRDPDLKNMALLGFLVCTGYMLANITAGLLNTASTAILFWFLLGIVPGLKDWDIEDEKAGDNLS